MSIRSQLVAVLVLLCLNRVNTFGTIKGQLGDVVVKTVGESVTASSPTTYCTDMEAGIYTPIDAGKWCGSEKTEEGCNSKFIRPNTENGYVDPCTWKDGACKYAQIKYKCPTACFGGASTGFASPSPPPVSPGGITTYTEQDCSTKWVSTSLDGRQGFVKKEVCEDKYITTTGRRLQQLEDCEAYGVTCKAKTTEECSSNDGLGVTEFVKVELSITAPDVLTEDQISFQCSIFRDFSGPTDDCACSIIKSSSKEDALEVCMDVPACDWDECDKPTYI